MASIVLFHSVLGLRAVEARAADCLRAAGHDVRVPDLFDGARTDELDEGYAIMERVGWDSICSRARDAADALSENAVLAGISMGAGVVASLWPTRPKAQAVLLIHGLASVPATARCGTPVQAHIAERDALFPLSEVEAWRQSAQESGLSAEVFTYDRGGRFFTDEGSPDYDARATALLWDRTVEFLRR